MVHVVVDDLSSSLVVQRNDALVEAVVFIAVAILDLAAVARVCSSGEGRLAFGAESESELDSQWKKRESLGSASLTSQCMASSCVDGEER